MSFLYLFDLIGTYAFAISGALVGAKKKMDIYGMFILALVTGVGGGTIRDMMLGRTPPFVFKDIWYLIDITIATFTVVFLYKKVLKNLKLINIADAIGLGVFTCIGATIAKDSGCSWYGIILFGLMTATVGGMIRDILAQEVPFVLQKEIYASASILGGFIFIFLDYLNINVDINIFITSLFVTVVRLLSVHKGWNLPKLFSR